MKRKKILFIYTNYSGFVKTDHEILSSEFEVHRYHYNPVKGTLPTFWQLLKQLIFLIFNIRNFDFVYIWFADLHSFLPVLISQLSRRKCFVVIGGYDVCRIPSLKYGVFYSKIRGFAAVFSMKNSTLNFPVSNYVARKVKAITRKDNFQTIHNCVNIQIPGATGLPARTMVLTVGNISTDNTYLLKGIDTFVEVARLLPEIQFCIAGFDQQRLAHLCKNFPQNLQSVGYLEHSLLAGYFLRSKIYCQLSRSESFGVALVEAMFHGCIPIVTNEGGMPEIVGDNRLIIKRNSRLIAERIKEMVLKYNEFDFSPVKKRIQNDFSYSTRAVKIHFMISNC